MDMIFFSFLTDFFKKTLKKTLLKLQVVRAPNICARPSNCQPSFCGEKLYKLQKSNIVKDITTQVITSVDYALLCIGQNIGSVQIFAFCVILSPYLSIQGFLDLFLSESYRISIEKIIFCHLNIGFRPSTF